MAVVKDRCAFKIEADQCIFRTRTNGDKISFGKGLQLNQEDATALTYLLRSGNQLRVIIKEA